MKAASKAYEKMEVRNDNEIIKWFVGRGLQKAMMI
jgi:hypothetical protein